MPKIDKTLAKEILAAKTPRNFVFVTGSVSNRLVLSRGKIGNDTITQVKQETGNGTAYGGKAVLEDSEKDGPKLVFLMKKPVPTLEIKLKRTIKESAGLTKVVEVRKLDAKESEPETDDVAPQDLKGAYETLRDELKDQVEGLKTKNPKAAEKCAAKLQEVEKAITGEGNPDYKKAGKTLRKVQEFAVKMLTEVSPEQKAIAAKAAFKTIRERLGPRVEALRSLNPQAFARVQRMLTEVDQKVGSGVPEDKRDYRTATKLLLKMREFVEAEIRKSLGKAGEDERNKAETSLKGADIVQRSYDQLRVTLANFEQHFANSPALAGYQDRAKQIGLKLQQFKHGEAATLLDPLQTELEKMLAEKARFETRLQQVERVVQQAEGLDNPKLPASLVQRVRDYLRGAQQLTVRLDFDNAIGGLGQVDDLIREAISDRKTFLEAAQETANLLHMAEGKLENATFKEEEQKFTDAYVSFQNGDTHKAYDVVTQVGARLKVALREQGIEDVEKLGTVKGQTTGGDEEKRVHRYRLNLDGIRKTLLFLAKNDPKSASEVENRLAEIQKLRDTDLGKAEEELGELVKELGKLVKELRGKLPKGPGDWDVPVPTPPKPQTLGDWSNDLKQRGVLTKVKRGKKLGAGGFGSVYLLEPDENNQGLQVPPLVVKVPVNEDGIEEMEKEAKLYQQIGEHPNLLKCLGMQDVDGTRGLVIEGVRGKTNDQFTKQLKAKLASGEITETEFWSTLQYTLSKTMSALAHIHDKGMAHNDIKPGNIMIDETTGDVKVIDLGIVNRLGDVVTGNDAPQFQAPENLSQKGSSPETDTLSAGAIAMGGLEGEKNDTYNFGDRKRMKSPFNSTVEEVIRSYGELTGDLSDEMAVQQETPTNPSIRRVNEKGEDDPQGTIEKRDFTRVANRSAFSDFMNALLHPDPSKRLSPKQAMEHPFLRDMILPEEQVRQVIQRSGKGETVIQGEEKARDDLVSILNSLAGTTYTVALGNAQKNTAEFNLDAIEPKDLLATRQKFTQQLQGNQQHELDLERAIKVLSELIAHAPMKNTPTYFQDNQKLELLKQHLVDFQNVRPELQRVLRTLDLRIQQSKETLSEKVESGELLDAKQIEQRVERLTTQRSSVGTEIDILLEAETPQLFVRKASLERMRLAITRLQAQTATERKNLMNLVQELTKRKAEREVIQGVQLLNSKFKEHIQELTKLEEKLKTGITEVEKQLNTLIQQVDQLDRAATDTFRGVANARAEFKKAGLEFEGKSKAPRDTVQAMNEFEQARSTFENTRQQYQNQLAGFRRAFEEQENKARQYQRQFGSEVPSGMKDVNGQLEGILNRIAEGKKALTT